MIFDTVILLVIARAMVNCELGSFRSLISPNLLKKKLNTKLIATFPILYLHQFKYHNRRIYEALTLRSLTLYIYGAPILDVSRSHTTTQHSR